MVGVSAIQNGSDSTMRKCQKERAARTHAHSAGSNMVAGPRWEGGDPTAILRSGNVSGSPIFYAQQITLKYKFEASQHGNYKVS